MPDRVVPMIHVPDVRATVDWYLRLGFTIVNTYDDGGDGLSFAIMSLGESQVMFNSDGRTSTERRREVDLYIYTDEVDALFEKMKDQVQVVEGPHDTFYGMREFILRDLNGFWITFARLSVFGELMTAVYKGNVSGVRKVLKSATVKPDILTAALAVASKGATENVEIKAALLEAGAVMPLQVDPGLLRSYTGKYKGDPGMEIYVTEKDGVLFAAPGNQEPLSLIALSEHSFRPIYFDHYGVITFFADNGETTGCVVDHGGVTMTMHRAVDS